MDLILEAGIFGPAIALAFTVGAFATVRADDALRTAQVAALTVVVLGILGTGLGQRLVDKAVQGVTDPAKQVALLSAGTREAAAGNLLGGGAGLLLIALGGAVAISRRRPD